MTEARLQYATCLLLASSAESLTAKKPTGSVRRLKVGEPSEIKLGNGSTLWAAPANVIVNSSPNNPRWDIERSLSKAGTCVTVAMIPGREFRELPRQHADRLEKLVQDATDVMAADLFEDEKPYQPVVLEPDPLDPDPLPDDEPGPGAPVTPDNSRMPF